MVSTQKNTAKFIKRIRRGMPFFWCLVTATGLWLTRELGKTSTEQISLDLHCVNVPKTVSLVSKIPEQLSFTIECTGLGYLNFLLLGDSEIELDLSYIEKRGVQRISTTNEIFTRSFGNQCKIIKVEPADLRFEFEKIDSKRVPIKPNIDVACAQQFRMKNQFSISPDSVSIYGPKTLLDNVQCIETQNLSVSKIRNSFTQSVDLVDVPNVFLSDSVVQLSVQVEKFTEISQQCKVMLINVPKDIVAFYLMPNVVEVNFLVGMSKVEQCDSSKFEIVADYRNCVNGLIPVELLKKPDFINSSDIVNILPQSVGIIAETAK